MVDIKISPRAAGAYVLYNGYFVFMSYIKSKRADMVKYFFLIFGIFFIER